MAGSNAALSDDDILAAFSKPKPGGTTSAPAAISTDDDILRAYSKPAPPSVPAPPLDAYRGTAEEAPDWSGLNKSLTDTVAPVNAAIARTLAPVQRGTTEYGPNATIADLPPDSPAVTIRSGSLPPQDIDPQATFNALSALKTKLKAEGKDPATDPAYVALLRQQAQAVSQNTQQAAQFLIPTAPGRGIAGLIEGSGNRLVPTSAAPARTEAATSGAGPVAASPAADNPLLARASPAEPPPGAPVPRSLGAAASGPGTATNMSPAQEAAYRSSAEGRKLLEPQPVGVPDTRTYVPGVTASTAEIEQSVNAAREAKAANVAHPEVSQAARETAAANTEARASYYGAMAGDDVSTGLLREAQKNQLNRDYPAAFAKAGTPDTKPITAAIRESLDTPRGRQNEQLQAFVKPLLDRLENADGTPKITNAEELYGFRESLNRMRSRASQSERPGLEHVAGEIGDLIAATDKQIEAAAPGYRQYMDNYSAAQRAIEEQQILQKHEPKLFDSQNNMTYNKFQTFMRQVVDARGAPGLNPYKSISDETMLRLWNLRDDLRRSASAQELARTPGSDTTQTAFDVARHLGAGAVRLGAHGIANTIAPVIGSLAVNTGEAMISARRAAKAQRQGVQRGLQNLNPNRLLPPED